MLRLNQKKQVQRLARGHVLFGGLECISRGVLFFVSNKDPFPLHGIPGAGTEFTALKLDTDLRGRLLWIGEDADANACFSNVKPLSQIPIKTINSSK